jgi:hypothetical protein
MLTAINQILVTKHGGHWLIRAAQNTNISNAPPPALRK